MESDDAHSNSESVTQLNSQGLAVVLRNQPGLDLLAAKKKGGGAIQSSRVSSGKSFAVPSLQVRRSASPSCSSMSDPKIEVCNRRFWLRNHEEEAENIWGLGKLLGVSFPGDNREMIKRLSEMEARDEAELSKIARRDGGGEHSDNQ